VMSEAGREPERGPAVARTCQLSRARRRRAAAWSMIGLGLLVALTPLDGGAAMRIGGPFELVDQEGATRTDADFRGSYMLIYFGFTYCPDLCPTTLLNISDALEDLRTLAPSKAERVVPVFISVDPERDTPDVLRSYAAPFDPRLVALTGTPRALAAVGRTYGVFAAKVPTGEPGGYVMDHTGFVYLIGPDGKYVQHFESDFSVDDLVEALSEAVVEAAVGGG
jgi:protein SCO1/2